MFWLPTDKRKRHQHHQCHYIHHHHLHNPYLISMRCIFPQINVLFQLYVEFMWLENVSAIFGSWVIFFIGCYGYMADTTSPESRYISICIFVVFAYVCICICVLMATLCFRTIRIAIMDGCFFAMDIIGNYINGPIYKRCLWVTKKMYYICAYWGIN